MVVRRILVAAAGVCAVLTLPLSAQATLSATAIQSPSSLNLFEIKLELVNTGSETVTSLRHVIPDDFRISEAHTGDGASCMIPEPREYTCGSLSIPPGGTWTAYFTTPPAYSDVLGFITHYIPAVGPSTFYLRSEGSETGPFQATWLGSKPSFGAVEACLVPRVTGKTLRAAKRSIANAGCAVGRVRYAWSRQRRGRVALQTPPPRAVLDSEGLVNLVVSRGRRR
jgi:hypothetical protein